jgi:anti-sigma regulatory factor (Ser/Thr protein kinase)
VISTVADSSQVAETRRAAQREGAALGFGAEALGRVAIIATELSTNILKHAGRGEVLIRPFADAEGEGLEILALDNGPGMSDVARCLGDGYTTVGTRGNGLGAVRRLSQRFGVFSRPGQGTAIVARCLDGLGNATTATAVVGAVRAVCPGETVSGDDFRVHHMRGATRVLLADGSGHGPFAARAAEEAVRIFAAAPEDPPEVVVGRIHRGLAPTRGAAIGLAEIEEGAGVVRFVGVGNVAGTLYDSAGAKKLVSMAGIAGHLSPRIREFLYPFSPPATLVLHSDGIGTRWNLDAYPGLPSAHAALVAGILYRDFRRSRDDAAVVSVRVAEK